MRIIYSVNSIHIFLLFYNDNFELVFSTIFLTNFERSTFPYTRKENQCEPFPAALAAFFFSLFYVGAKLWTANKINCAWFEWNENTNEIPWNPVAGIFRNKTWVLFYGSALFLRLINRYRLLSNWYLNKENPNLFAFFCVRFEQRNSIRMTYVFLFVYCIFFSFPRKEKMLRFDDETLFNVELIREIRNWFG